MEITVSGRGGEWREVLELLQHAERGRRSANILRCKLPVYKKIRGSSKISLGKPMTKYRPRCVGVLAEVIPPLVYCVVRNLHTFNSAHAKRVLQVNVK